MDITEYPDLGSSAFRSLKAVTFPEKPAYASYVKPLLKHLSKEKMRTHLEKFTSFHTRYYKSSYGAQSAAWLASTINSTIHASNASSSSSSSGPHVSLFPHSWGQPSIIVTLPGKGPHTVVVGAHQDSINLFFPSLLAAPGADDDGSGTVTILEALRVLLNTSAVSSGEQRNTVEFHWYSAEEGGLLGSQAVFARYEKEGRQVKAMLQQGTWQLQHSVHHFLGIDAFPPFLLHGRCLLRLEVNRYDGIHQGHAGRRQAGERWSRDGFCRLWPNLLRQEGHRGVLRHTIHRDEMRLRVQRCESPLSSRFPSALPLSPNITPLSSLAPLWEY